MAVNERTPLKSDFVVDEEEGADFETAITATGFGKFNIILILIAIPTGWSSMFETTTMSYVFPAAQCDLNLTLDNKGVLNAITYVGMISSAFMWGFLCDTLGRKKLIIIGLLLDALFVFQSAIAQNFTMLIIAKFLGGFIVNGPFAALSTYLSEIHSAQHRARTQMLLGVIYSAGNALLPLLAWGILPLNFDVTFGDNLQFHSWNLFLCICALPTLISGFAFMFLPETPKFLMTTGRNEEALKVFQEVYSLNTGNPPESYPIKQLIEETKVDNKSKYGGKVTANRTKTQALKEGWQQMKPLFFPPYLVQIILVCVMEMLILMSLNTLRLWLPQIFQAINDYSLKNNGSASLCTMLDEIRPAENANLECLVNLDDNASVYINSIIVGSVTTGVYIVAGILINILGKKKLLYCLCVASGLSAMSIYLAVNSAATIALSSIFIAFASISANTVIAVVVDIFPTTLRTMTISMSLMMGRGGAMLGNLIFPTLLLLGCAPPFFSIGFVILICAFLTCFLANTDFKALQ